MRFCEFFNILYKYVGSSSSRDKYFLYLFDTLLRNPDTEEDMTLSRNDRFNPFASLQPDTLIRLSNGKNPLSLTKVGIVLSRYDTDKFAKYINDLNWSNHTSMKNDLMAIRPDFDNADNIGYSCADLFLEILGDIYDGHEGSSATPAVATPSMHTSIPAACVYYDKTDSKIHIGDIVVAIPKEIAPPDDITPEESKYVNALLEAYAQARGLASSSQADIKTLPKPYNRNFRDQRINYFSAARIERFTREHIVQGDAEFEKWLSGTFDYIKDTLWDDYDDGYKRLVSVMKKVVDSSTVSVVDDFRNLVGAKERKGACHLLVNADHFNWVDND